MNKGDLAQAVSDKTGMSRSDANRAIDAVFRAISDALKKGEEVRVLGFGNFVVADKGPSTGRNPKTGETMEIAASKRARFKPGKALRDALNG